VRGIIKRFHDPRLSQLSNHLNERQASTWHITLKSGAGSLTEFIGLLMPLNA
jgi:hypothetical protein